ncbi:MAG: SDR family oxidoreductase [Candidatus Methanolliviera hydrocarbonicum]|uniref:SDR family oxidoreductase n=1 Tax=Candidatus Methanolliviera hydrocarbonicum TaxID=2491085 RepID=A0A520KUS9_9EURY|nr:MAG: SDR family oxidoreductase [Candidatus Methanolliviera hydrocarbonicum]
MRFGRGIAIEYAKRGADLVLVDINEELLEETSKKIEEEYNQEVVPVVCDVSNSKQVKKMADQAFKEIDNVYILVNNAGIAANYGNDLLAIDEETYDTIMDVNLKGQWLVAKFVCQKMKSQKFEPLAGKVICTASIAGIVADGAICVYSISKAGVIALMQCLARNLAPKITVNAISPGYHVTGIYEDSEEVMRFTMEEGHVKTPLNRLGTVLDIANVAVFLASTDSNFITGHNFPVDGGIVEVGVPAHYLKTDV